MSLRLRTVEVGWGVRGVGEERGTGGKGTGKGGVLRPKPTSMW